MIINTDVRCSALIAGEDRFYFSVGDGTIRCLLTERSVYDHATRLGREAGRSDDPLQSPMQHQSRIQNSEEGYIPMKRHRQAVELRTDDKQRVQAKFDELRRRFIASAGRLGRRSERAHGCPTQNHDSGAGLLR